MKKRERLLPVPENFFFDRSLQTTQLGIAFDVRSGNLQHMETRLEAWSVNRKP